MKEEIKGLMFFKNGNTAVFDTNGKQISSLQKSWLLMFIEFLQSKGVRVEKIEDITMPDGRQARYSKKYHNWEIL